MDWSEDPAVREAARLAAIVESSSDAILAKTLDGTITAWNSAAEQLYGYSSDEALGRPVSMLFPPGSEDELQEILERVGRGGHVEQRDAVRIRKDGQEVEVAVSISPIRDARGTVVGASTIARDVSAWRTAERSLGRLAAIVESSGEALVTLELDGTIASWNRGAERTFGYTADQIVGRSFASLSPPESAGEVVRLLAEVADGREFQNIETVRDRRDGVRIDVLLTLSPIRNEMGEVIAAASAVRDVTSLRQTERSYRRLFERHPAPMWIYDAESLAFLEVNEAAVAQYGWSRDEFLSMTILDIRPDEEREAVLESVAVTGRDRDAGIWRHCRRDGTIIEVSVVSAPIEFDGLAARVVLAQDVTEQRRLEERLRHSQKLEAIGRLAGGVAHDFNNVLMVVRACSALLLKRLDDDALRKDVVQIDDAAQRGADLTRQLLAFSKQQVLRPELTDVNSVVEQTLELLQKVIGEDVEIVLDLARDLPAVLVDRGQLTQVVLNLAVNARDAMPEGGTLSIATGTTVVDEAAAARRPGLSTGPYVFLQATDTGVGMDEDTAERVFDPFFTTKEHGTGLGLASVHGIVDQSGGYIWLYSEPGVGTTFKLSFPVADGEPLPQPEPPPDAAELEGDETILLVEDEDVLRAVVAETLRLYGYTVIEAGTGADALEIARGHAGPIDVLLTDVVMPGMTGRDLAETMAAERPGIAVLFTSGYPADTIVPAGPRTGYVQKPSAPAELVAAIRSVVAARPSR